MSTPYRPDEPHRLERIERLLWLTWINTCLIVLMAGVALIRFLALTR
jgi:hypothetical protein